MHTVSCPSHGTCTKRDQMTQMFDERQGKATVKIMPMTILIGKHLLSGSLQILQAYMHMNVENCKSVYIKRFRLFSLLEEIVCKLSAKVICIPGYNCFIGLLAASNFLSDVILVRPLTIVILATASVILNT